MAAISVIMPVYNTEEPFLREAVESILNQTFADFEFLIINDGSENNVEDVIKSYNDNRIIYIKNENNLGIIKSLNKAIDIARGKYIARMDSDDISYPERLETQYRFMENNPDCGVCGSNIMILSGNKFQSSNYKESHNEIVYSMLFKGCHLCHPTAFIRKKVLDENSLKYNEEDIYAEDYGLWLNLMDKTRIHNLKDILVKYRMHDKNVSVIHKDFQDKTLISLLLKFQHKFFGFKTDNLHLPLFKMMKNIKLTTSELDKILDYYFEWFEADIIFKERIYTKNQVLGLCKKAIFNTEPDLKLLFVIFKPKLIKILILRYLNLL